MKKYEGNLIAEDIKIAIVISRFNDFINNKLLEGALDFIKRHKGKEENIDLFYVPGAFEIPLAASRIASKKNYDGIICLGTVIRGATPHFEYVSAEVSKGVANVALKYELPISFGVLTTDTIEQAIERAGTKAGNKGWEAAQAAVEQINLFRSF